MIPEQYIELMHGEIDGINSDEESRRLKSYLADSPEATAHFQDLKEAVALVGGVESLKPPAGLRERILAAVDELPAPRSAASPVSSGEGRRGDDASWFRFWSRPDGRLAFAAGFAAAALLAVVIWQATAPLAPVSTGDLRGAILLQVAAGEGSSGAPVTLALGGAEVTALARRAGRRTLVELGVVGETPVTLRLAATGPIGCVSFRADPPVPVSVETADRQITLMVAGTGEIELVLDHSETTPPDIELQVIEGATVRRQESMTRGIN